MASAKILTFKPKTAQIEKAVQRTANQAADSQVDEDLEYHISWIMTRVSGLAQEGKKEIAASVLRLLLSGNMPEWVELPRRMVSALEKADNHLGMYGPEDD